MRRIKYTTKERYLRYLFVHVVVIGIVLLWMSGLHWMRSTNSPLLHVYTELVVNFMMVANVVIMALPFIVVGIAIGAVFKQLMKG